MERVLVTGGGGFVGRACLAALAGRCGELHALTRSDRPADTSGVRWIRGDLLAPGTAARVIGDVRPTHLLHLAWIATPPVYWTSPENPLWVAATLSLLREFAARGGRRAVLAGTCAEYDWSHGLCREATTPLRPATLYGRCKDECRERAESLARECDLSLAWSRLFWLYGPGDGPRRLVPSVVESLLAGRPALCSPGTQIRDFLYVDDVADALTALLAADVRGAINVAGGQAAAISDVARSIGDLLGRPDLIRLGALPLPLHDPPLLLADVTRLRDELRWSPAVDLEVGLRRTIDWHRARAAGSAAYRG